MEERQDRAIAWLLALVLGVAASACGGDGRPPIGKPPGPPPALAAPDAEDALRLAFMRARQADADASHDAQAQAGAVMLQSRAQGLSATFDAEGARLQGRASAVRVRWTGVGRPGARETVGAAETLSFQGPRVTLDHGAGRVAWWQSGPLGLEQGFVLASPARGAGELRVTLAVDGLSPVLAADGARVRLVDSAGDEVLSVTDLFVEDARAKLLPAAFAVEDGDLTLRIDDTAAAYPIHVDPLWVQRVELIGSDSVEFDEFGTSVSLWGDRALVGAPNHNGDRGAAYVFTWNGTSWIEEQKLTASDAGPSDAFGESVSLGVDRAVVGAPHHAAGAGAAYVFAWNGSSWIEEQKLSANDAAPDDVFGFSVSLWQDRVLVGAQLDDDAGADSGSAYVFRWNGASWNHEDKLTASDGAPADRFGYGVSLWGDRALMSAPLDDDGGSESGSAYVFVLQGAEWEEEAKLVPSDGAANDCFGISVSLWNKRALVGADARQFGITGTGSAYVFARSSTGWAEEDKLTASDGGMGDAFGFSVSLRADRALVGAHFDGAPSSADGSAYVFERSGALWTETQRLTVDDPGGVVRLGESVSQGHDRALVGALFGADAAGTATGSAYVFDLLLADGESCSDGDECGSGFCSDGVCCDEACGGDDTDDCQACSLAAGATTDGVCAARADDDPCDDGDACTQSDSCDAGACVGADPVMCIPVDLCHDEGSCDPGTGDCSEPEKPDGASCDDGVFCNGEEQCAGGVCGAPGGDPCAALVGDADIDCSESCDEARAACVADDPAGSSCGDGLSVGLCDGSGQCGFALGEGCLAPTECESGFCVDGVCCEEACDRGCDACDLPGTVGICEVVVSGTVCRSARGDCDVAEVCNGAAGACPSDVLAPDGTTCDGGVCEDGTCASAGEGGAGGAGGQSGMAGNAAAPEPPSEDGCSCRVAGGLAPRRGHGWLLLLGLVALAVRRPTSSATTARCRAHARALSSG
jgi:MYXO-CTERM domain-containing protein